MQNPERGKVHTARIIQFTPKRSQETESPKQAELKATTIATLIAVTIIHDADVNPEERLMDLIELSGEVEILDALDATDELESESFQSIKLNPTPSNDN